MNTKLLNSRKLSPWALSLATRHSESMVAPMAKILFLEDDDKVADAVESALHSERHTVERTASGEDALTRATVSDYDLIILDWTVPDVSGVDVCQRFRAEGGTTPVLMLTGKHLISEKVTALDAGADDYLTKPFNIQEFMARVRALLRRRGSGYDTGQLVVGELKLDVKTFTVTCGGQNVSLIPKEFAILELLMTYPGVVFSHEAIFRRLWKSDEATSPEIVRTHLKNLRKKIEAVGAISPIETVHGVGYKLLKPNT